MSKKETVVDRNGIVTEIHYGDDDVVEVRRSQRVDPILDRNAELRSISQRGKHGYLLGEVPLEVHLSWEKEFEEKHGKVAGKDRQQLKEAFLMAKFRDRDWYRLKTTDMRV